MDGPTLEPGHLTKGLKLFLFGAGLGKAQRRRLQQLVQDLAATDAAEAIPRIVERLQGLLAERLDPDALFDAAEILRVAVDRILVQHDRFEDRQQASALRGSASGLTRDLMSAIAETYAQCADALFPTASPSRPEDGHEFAAVHRALTYTSNLLLYDYRANRLPAVGLWQRVHAEYRRAETMGASTKTLPKTPRSGSDFAPATIQAAYARLILFAAADPYRMMPLEAVFVLDFLSRHTGGISITPVETQTVPALAWVVDLDSDSGPFRPATSLETRAQDLRAIVFEPLVAEIDRVLDAQQRPTDAASALNLSAMRRLKRVLTESVSRRHQRLATAEPVEACFGLEAVHQGLFGGESFHPETQEKAIRSACGLHTQSTLQALRSLFAHFPGRLDDNLEVEEITLGDEGSQRRSGLGPVSPEQPRQAFTIADRDPDGVRLTAAADLAAHCQVQVGDIGQLSSRERQLPWDVGVVRWVRRSEGSLQMGFTRLAPSAMAVATRLREGKDFLRSLILPNTDPARKGAVLVAPAHAYIPGQEVILLALGKIYTIRIEALLGATQNFAQFSYAVVSVLDPGT